MAKGSVNKVIILGRLGQDPEFRSVNSGTSVANINVATTELGAKDESGKRNEMTEWHRIVLFGRLAEVSNQYSKKGDMVYIEGRLQTRKWQDQNGNDRWSTDIVASEYQMIGGNSQGSNQQAPQQQAPQQQAPQQQAPQQQAPQQQAPQQQAPQQSQSNNFDDFDDDIPF